MLGAHLGPPVFPWRGLRGVDVEGAGGFGAPRAGDRIHTGLDVLALPGDTGITMHRGRVVYLGYVYGRGTPMRSIHIQGLDEWEHIYTKTYYVDPRIRVGDELPQGATIGIVQNIAGYHNAEGKMRNHVHIVVRTFVDPGPYLVDLPNPIVTGGR